MDFFEAKNAAALKKEFGTQHFALSSKTSVTAMNRPHTSLSMVKEKARELNLNEAKVQALKEPSLRYMIIKELSFDILVTIYDVNSQTVMMLRPSSLLDQDETSTIKLMLSKFRRPNFEIRAIGMQNGDTSLVKVLDDVHSISKGNLIEADFFGNLKRHIAFDIKTGMSYDLLLLDRIYRGGETLNSLTPEEFKSKTSGLKFV